MIAQFLVWVLGWDSRIIAILNIVIQERMMTSLFFHGRGGRVCDWQKFETGGISGVY